MATEKAVYRQYNEKSRGTTLWERLNPLRYTQTISIDRARLLTEGYKEYEGYQFFHKRGLAIAKVLREFPIYIDDDQLLVGDFGSKPMCPEFFPDISAGWMIDYVDEFGWKGRDGFYAFENEADAAEAREIALYFRNKDGQDTWIKYLGDEWPYEHLISEQGAYITNTVSEIYAEKGWNVPDIARIVRKGVRGLVADIDAKLKKIDLMMTDEDYRAREFLLGLKEMLLAGVDYAHRYAALAREKAAAEADETRKAELLEIARVCDRVPEYPAETFQEALQSFYFAVLMIFYDTRTYGMGFGRVDQFMYPQYKADIESGHIDKEYAIQLLECFRCKIMGKRQFQPAVMVQAITAESHFHNCILGGVDPKTGRDATNELSYLWLEAAFRVRTTHPTLSVRWHPNIDPKFMDRAMQLVAKGMGFPAFFNDAPTIEYLLARGYTLEEARSYAIGGCVLHQVPGKNSAIWPVVINQSKMLELAINDGFDPISKNQLGPKTGRLADMQSYDEVIAAYKTQCEFFAKVTSRSSRSCRIQHGDSFTEIMMSAFIDDCIERGKVCGLGGAAHGDNTHYVVPVGVVDLANELYVLKNAIFTDEPICSKEELADAMAKNWEGYEELHARLLALPKFGNDDPAVDGLANEIYAYLRELWYAQPAAYCGHFEVAPHTIGLHTGTGARLGAMPCGRMCGEAMSDGGVSPTQGTDHEGPAAVIKSAGSIDQTDIYGPLLNMRFSPKTMSTPEGRANVIALVKTYFADYGGKHIQFNVISRDEMLAAKKEPWKHTDLIVRVAGYSAYWTDLLPKTHDELIKRCEYDAI